MECRCHDLTELQGADAEEYAAGHLRADGDAYVCADTGRRWQLDYPDGEQARLVPERPT